MKDIAFTYNVSFMDAKGHVGKIGQTFADAVVEYKP